MRTACAVVLLTCVRTSTAYQHCVPLRTATQLYLDRLRGGLRTHMFPACRNMPHPFHYLTGGGDRFWVNSKRYSDYGCVKLHAWLDSFYTAIRERVHLDDW
jgi:hypothetical protein